jgi:FAD/FMN-containing dehydrogenase
VMQKLKSSLDPLWIMNPGELVSFTRLACPVD